MYIIISENVETNCHDVTIGSPRIAGDPNLIIQTINTVRTERECREHCNGMGFGNRNLECRSYYYESDSNECFLMRASFLQISRLIPSIGAPKHCVAKIDECVSKHTFKLD